VRGTRGNQFGSALFQFGTGEGIFWGVGREQWAVTVGASGTSSGAGWELSDP
jgi:hypothetical protein